MTQPSATTLSIGRLLVGLPTNAGAVISKTYPRMRSPLPIQARDFAHLEYQHNQRQRLGVPQVHSLDPPYVSDLQGPQSIPDAGRSGQTVLIWNVNTLGPALFVLKDADETGDGTVTHRSGKAPTGELGVQVCVPFAGCPHEGAYKEEPQPDRRRFTLWAIIKIAYDIRNTSMAYPT